MAKAWFIRTATVSWEERHVSFFYRSWATPLRAPLNWQLWCHSTRLNATIIRRLAMWMTILLTNRKMKIVMMTQKWNKSWEKLMMMCRRNGDNFVDIKLLPVDDTKNNSVPPIKKSLRWIFYVQKFERNSVGITTYEYLCWFIMFLLVGDFAKML